MKELKVYGTHSQSTEKNRWINCHNQLLELEKENEELKERIRYLEKIISEIVRALKDIVILLSHCVNATIKRKRQGLIRGWF